MASRMNDGQCALPAVSRTVYRISEYAAENRESLNLWPTAYRASDYAKSGKPKRQGIPP